MSDAGVPVAPDGAAGAAAEQGDARGASTPSVGKTMAWLSLGTLTYLGVQWLLSVLVFRLAGPQAAGNYGLALAASSVAYAVALFGMRPFQISDTRRVFSDRVYFGSRAATSLLAVGAFAVAMPFTAHVERLWPILLAFLGFRLTEGWFDVFHGVLQNGNRMDRAGLALIARAGVELVAFVGILVFTGRLEAAAIALFAVSLIALFALELPLSRPLWRNGPTFAASGGWPAVGRLLAQCAPLLVANLAYSLIMFLSRNAVSAVWGQDIQGGYSSIAAPLLLVPVLVSYLYTPFMPGLAEAYRHGDRRALGRLITRLLLAIAVIFGVGVGVLIAAGGPLFELVFGARIRAYDDLVVPMALSVCATALVYFGNALLTSVRHLRWTLYAAVASVAVVWPSALPLTASYGPNGASAALIAGQLVQALLLGVGFTLALKRRSERGR